MSTNSTNVSNFSFKDTRAQQLILEEDPETLSNNQGDPGIDSDTQFWENLSSLNNQHRNNPIATSANKPIATSDDPYNTTASKVSQGPQISTITTPLHFSNKGKEKNPIHTVQLDAHLPPLDARVAPRLNQNPIALNGEDNIIQASNGRFYRVSLKMNGRDVDLSQRDWEKAIPEIERLANRILATQPSTQDFTWASIKPEENKFSWKTANNESIQSLIGSSTVKDKAAVSTLENDFNRFKKFCKDDLKTIPPLQQDPANKKDDTLPDAIQRIQTGGELQMSDMGHYLGILKKKHAKMHYTQPLDYRHYERPKITFYNQIFKKERATEKEQKEALEALVLEEAFHVIPILIDGHYVTIIVDFREKTILFYDSLHSKSEESKARYRKVKANLKNLRQLFNNKLGKGWEIKKNTEAHQIGNGVDCGIHCLDLVENIASSTSSPKEAFEAYNKKMKDEVKKHTTTAYIQTRRTAIAAELQQLQQTMQQPQPPAAGAAAPVPPPTGITGVLHNFKNKVTGLFS